ncbi:MAG: class I SAM-dependent methyltransferase [Acidimicrobiales bacterium]|nr:class I SAM-dependent methyltransferase [Acidimicrobiales bacterium]HRW36589.1 TylF/MycF/NovP-related O-methyltransferase [Aquihabitans sp.]
MPTRTRFPRRRRRTGTAAQYEVFGATLPPRRVRWAKGAYEWLSIPFAATFLLSGKIHEAYAMSWWQKVRLAHRLYRNTQVLPTLTSYRAHLAMAAKLLGTSPKTKGVVVECGCFQGGATANLSILCDLVDRDLIVYDSFEGLPPAEETDRYASAEGEGFLRAELDDVKANVAAHGVIERCTFRKGWFDQTLPQHTEPIVLAFLDVDYQASLHTCVKELWPRLTKHGHVFIDEYVYVDYCALFFSESWWRTHLDLDPPGIMGVGTGVGVGQYYLGPYPGTPMQASTSLAYTRKDFRGRWTYVAPDEPIPG